jgi:preprotein translocase subunit YajC
MKTKKQVENRLKKYKKGSNIVMIAGIAAVVLIGLMLFVAN